MVGTMCVSSSPAAVQAATMVLRSQPNRLLQHGGVGLAGRHYETGGLSSDLTKFSCHISGTIFFLSSESVGNCNSKLGLFTMMSKSFLVIVFFFIFTSIHSIYKKTFGSKKI